MNRPHFSFLPLILTAFFFCLVTESAAPRKVSPPLIELTYNWDKEIYAGGRNFGHLSFAVDDIRGPVHRTNREIDFRAAAKKPEN